MAIFKVTFASGVNYDIEARSLHAAKVQATKLASFGGGSYSVTDPDTGAIYGREFWQDSARHAYGWHDWRELDA